MLNISSVRIYEHVRHLAEEVGPRVGGTKSERKAAGYVAGNFARYGMDTRLQEFPVRGFFLKKAELSTIGPVRKEIHCIPWTYCGVANEMVGRLVYANTATGNHCGEKNVNGNIVLIGQPQEDLLEASVRIVARIAERKPAGIVVFSRAGPPCVVSLNPENAPSIPVVSISSWDGQELLTRMLRGKDVFLEMTVDAEKRMTQSQNVIGTLSGKNWPRGKIVIGAHLDTVTDSPGANDNASGIAAVMEIGRCLARKSPKRTLEFVAFGAEELHPYCVGSRFYVKEHMQKLDQIACAITIDEAAVGAETDSRMCVKTKYLENVYEGKRKDTPKWLDQHLRDAARKMGYELHLLPIRGVSDHVPFLINGIPASFIRWVDHPWWHTPQDILINIDPEKIRKIATAGALVAQKLSKLRELNRSDE